jgi:hypothetical protein
MKDDLGRLRESIAQADAIALAAPCFAIGAPSVLKTIMDRLAAWAFEQMGNPTPKKFGAAVLVGGAEPNWLSMQRLLPAEFLQLFNCETVGMFTIGGIGLRSEILLHPAWIERIHGLGEHLSRSMENGIRQVYPFTELEQSLVCPVCSSDSFHVDRRGHSVCVVCSTEIRRFRAFEKIVTDRPSPATESIYTPQLAEYHAHYVGRKISRGMDASEEVLRRSRDYFERDVLPVTEYAGHEDGEEQGLAEVQWDEEGEKTFTHTVPTVFRGFVRKAVEKKARKLGVPIISRDVFLKIKRDSGN